MCLLPIFLEYKAFLYIDILNRHLDYIAVGSLLKASFKEATVRAYFILYIASIGTSNVSKYWVPFAAVWNISTMILCKVKILMSMKTK